MASQFTADLRNLILLRSKIVLVFLFGQKKSKTMKFATSETCYVLINRRRSTNRVVFACFSYVFPSMDELANQLDHVLRYFGLESVVGLGVGAGGNILARFAYRQPAKVTSVGSVVTILLYHPSRTSDGQFSRCRIKGIF